MNTIDKKGLGIGIIVIIATGIVGFLIANFWSMPLSDYMFVKSDCSNSNEIINFYGNTTAQKIQTCNMWNHGVDNNKPVFKYGGLIIFTFGVPIAIANILFRSFQIHRPYEWIMEHEKSNLKSKGLNPHGTLPKGFDDKIQKESTK